MTDETTKSVNPRRRRP